MGNYILKEVKSQGVNGVCRVCGVEEFIELVELLGLGSSSVRALGGFGAKGS